MKKLLLVLIAIIVVGLMVFSSCAEPAPAPAPVPAPAPEVKPMTLKYADIGTATGFQAREFQWAWNEIEKRTEGRVKVELYASSSLLGLGEMLEGVQQGAADMNKMSGDWFPAQLPYQYIINQPTFVPSAEWIRNPANLVDAYWEFWDDTPTMRENIEKWNQTIWSLTPFGAYDIFSTVLIDSLDDFDGVRIRAVGLKAKYLFEPLGAIPVNISPPEVHGALQKGTAEAAFVGLSWGDDFGIAEVSDYVILTSGTYGTALIGVNLDTLNKMTPADREAFMAVGREMSSRYANAMYEKEPELLRGYKDVGVTVVDFPKDERNKWKDMSEKEVYKAFLEANKDVPKIRTLFEKWLTVIGASELMPE